MRNTTSKEDCQAMERQHRSVRFTNNKVFTIPSLAEYSDEEIKYLYISTQEAQKMWHQQQKVIQKMEQCKGKKSSYRGLEVHTEKGDSDFQRRRINCIDLVMDEQDIQMEKDIYDFEKLRKISKKASKQSKMLARKKAEKDAALARKYLEFSWEPKLLDISEARSAKSRRSNILTTLSTEGLPSTLH